MHAKSILTLMILVPTLTLGCRQVQCISGCPKEESGSASHKENVQAPVDNLQPKPSSGPSNSTAPVVIPSAPTETVQTTVPGTGFSLTRVTPEQTTRNLTSALGFTDFTYQDTYLGIERDWLFELFNVGLGGIDFQTASFRDFSTKAQTLLIARIYAWQVARITVEHDGNNPGSARVFTECNIDTDGPSDQAWRNQLDDLFWRLYARPPSNTEVSAVTTTFNNVLSNESNNHRAAWMAILYALVASEEFWHI